MPRGSKQSHMGEHFLKILKGSTTVHRQAMRQVRCNLRQFLSKMIPTQPRINCGIPDKETLEFSTSGKACMDRRRKEILQVKDLVMI